MYKALVTDLVELTSLVLFVAMIGVVAIAGSPA
ncbi:NADH:ubiquinone oxidoreductase subunit 6 (subunit J) [Pseudochelatococcus lubricantis]|uniref:NADH:ubiquinone oxidoreductase subunit 6 (Subunit J) n=1 Tax=Pseudochelatococcus lubricantis TaxID=1538102 RepID=A0ABX0UZP9_9HYPH|nr:NADH:ubiquinone oxidoreductase subunit 6 (subunit J) [Pseudochelatococcus lubricantis]